MSRLTTCAFFDKLPAELRLEIYELAFTADTEIDTEVDLKAPTPPSNSILLTCKKAHEEACDLYKTAYRHYWRATNFIFRAVWYGDEPFPPPNWPEDRDLAQIRRLRVEFLFTDNDPEVSSVSRLLDACGVWEKQYMMTLGDPPEFALYSGTDFAYPMHYDTMEDLEKARAARKQEVPMTEQIREMIGAEGQVLE